ncbi:MAG TPA: hypothetical protein VFW65_28965 [Pseudonocardiaceae bacterium]|nr:hypothetical protein [Pseudonocardiaceae bacterium]
MSTTFTRWVARGLIAGALVAGAVVFGTDAASAASAPPTPSGIIWITG